MNKTIVYSAPGGAINTDDFAVYVRNPGQAWEQLFVYEAKVDMHQVRQASMAYFDMSGRVEVRIESLKQSIQEAVIRPLSANLSFEHTEKTLSFTLDRPLKLSVEINGERFSNLHLFANPIEAVTPDPMQDHVLLLKPAIHRTEDIYRLLATPKVEGATCRIRSISLRGCIIWSRRCCRFLRTRPCILPAGQLLSVQWSVTM